MPELNIAERISKLETEIEGSPKGALSVKKIGPTRRYCPRLREGERIREKYVLSANLPALREKIERRKKLETEDGELYDRRAMLRTTHISFSEFARVLGYDDLDTYIQFGGTMTGGGTEYNAPPQIFADAKNTRKYANTAI